MAFFIFAQKKITKKGHVSVRCNEHDAQNQQGCWHSAKKNG